MPKVTFLTGEYPPMQGGIADYLAHLTEYITPLGTDSSILITRRWQETLPPNHQLPIYPTIPNWGWRCWPAITKFLNTHQPDVIHIQYQAAAFDLGGWINWLPWYLKKRHTTTKVVITFHDLRMPYIFPKAGPFRWKSILALARYSDAVICTDRENTYTLQLAIPALNNIEETNNQLPITNYRPEPSRRDQSPNLPISQSPLLTHIPLGNNAEPQPPPNFNRITWRAKYNVQDNTLLLAYFGFLNESKGGEELIEALALLRQQGIDAHLLFIGGEVGDADPTNITYAQRVQALIDRHRLA
ncbi:MAG: glycosyltransferase, partial [Chloroflexi bacterium]|nr:glycosyltransferase [Chloroflexota bacterium]